MSLSKVLVGAALVASTLAAPGATSSSSLIVNQQQLNAALAAVRAIKDPGVAAVAGQALLQSIVPAASPNSTSSLEAGLKEILNPNNPTDILTSGAQVLLNGFAGSDYINLLNSYTTLSNANNNNLREPRRPIYPKASPEDAPYSLSEHDLRKVLYIPPNFTYGKIQPVIFLPGTGAIAGQNFGPNYGKLFTANKVADPVYLNAPDYLLDDAQVTSEYVSYAINYISGITGKNVSTISWSQGSLNGQWSLKYWPSTRKVLSNAIRISADLHGTVNALLLCPPGLPSPFCVPSVVQQLYNSNFVTTLRKDGGDSAYVPTTNIYSIFDEIVQPQENPNASGSINDARNVGVSNTELQEACTAVLPGGTIYNDHEGVLYNALAYALAVDALTHDGPGQLSRIDVRAECAKFAADGLSLPDILATEALIPIAGGAILAYPDKVTTEPPIMAYAAGN